MLRSSAGLKVVTLIAVLSIGTAAPALADLWQSGIVGGGRAASAPFAVDGAWVVLDEFMSTGDFFTGTWDWTSPVPVLFTITDLFAVTDVFEVYDFGELVFSTPALPDWDAQGFADPFGSSPWTGDPDTALADERFSGATWLFGAGSHSITIRDVFIPSDSSSEAPFPDGTVAFSVAAVPASGAIVLGAMGLGMIAWVRRRVS